MIGNVPHAGLGIGAESSCSAVPLEAESAKFSLHAEHGDITGIALVFLVSRAFSSGMRGAHRCREAISNGVPAFRKPKSRNAAKTLVWLGGIAITPFMGDHRAHGRDRAAKVAERPAEQLAGAPEGYQQKTSSPSPSRRVFHDFPSTFYLITGVTAPSSCWPPTPPSTASRFRLRSWPGPFSPRQLHAGDRLAFSNRILLLALAGDRSSSLPSTPKVTALIQLAASSGCSCRSR